MRESHHNEAPEETPHCSPPVYLKPGSRLGAPCGIRPNLVCPVEGYDPSALEAVQLEDGSTAYIHHPVSVPSDSTILAVQTEVGLEDLAAEEEEGFSADTVVALEQYASKVSRALCGEQGERGLHHLSATPWPLRPSVVLLDSQPLASGDRSLQPSWTTRDPKQFHPSREQWQACAWAHAGLS